MKHWRLATGAQFCGGPCGARIVEGQPVLELTLAGLARRLVRCQACAGEPVNLEDAAPVVSSRGAVMQRLSEIMPERFDAKAAQAGSDE